jgi:hypothetical protein
VATKLREKRDRAVVDQALRGPLTDEKRRAVAEGVSDPVKRAVRDALRRLKGTLRELADY